jgi:hypothetical protein
VIRNNGNLPLTSLKINYGVAGFPVSVYDWTGNLPTGETAHVSLPTLPWVAMLPDSDAVFMATVSLPNGATDQYADNDAFKTPFKMSERLATNGFVVWMKTNNRADNRWYIYNEAGTVVASREDVAANKNYKDTLWLPNGCYRFEVEDDGGDGIQWQYYAGQGSGFVRFSKKNQSGTLKSFYSDFGSKLTYYFTLLDTLSGIRSPEITREEMVVYPNPASKELNVVFALPSGEKALLSITDLSGRKVLEQKIQGGASEYKIQVANLPSGLYMLNLTTVDMQLNQKVVIGRGE